MKKFITPMALLALGSQMAFGSIYAVGGEEANVLNTTDCTHTFLEDGVFSLAQEMDVRILLVGGAGGVQASAKGGSGTSSIITTADGTVLYDYR